jgi:HSP20 family protein
MTLVKWNPMHASREMSPFAGLEGLRHNMDRLLESWASDIFGNGDSRGAMWTPRLDIEETDQAFVIQADLPGIEKDAIDVHLEGNTLFLSGERKGERQPEQGFSRYERLYGKFQRAFTLPVSVEADKIEAKYVNGVLTITVPKSEDAKPKRIAIEAA